MRKTVEFYRCESWGSFTSMYYGNRNSIFAVEYDDDRVSVWQEKGAAPPAYSVIRVLAGYYSEYLATAEQDSSINIHVGQSGCQTFRDKKGKEIFYVSCGEKINQKVSLTWGQLKWIIKFLENETGYELPKTSRAIIEQSGAVRVRLARSC